MRMNLATFRRLTANLSGDLEMLCAGAKVWSLWHNENYVSIDNEDEVDEPEEAIQLWTSFDEPEKENSQGD
jgi:uncharacterized protein YecE (DUF72 family)